jgi:hypothetical protein
LEREKGWQYRLASKAGVALRARAQRAR